MENQVVKTTSNTKLTKAALQEAPNLGEMLSLPAVQDRWVDTYSKISGKPDGELRFEAEKVLFMQTIQGSKAFDKVDRFSIYSSFIELAISGLTLRDGISYVIPYGDKAQFQVGWQGRLEQITELQNVVHVPQPQVVYDCDHFEYEKGMKTIIKSHKPAVDRPADARILHVYLVVQFTHGLEVYMMDRADVLEIRDKYSQSYKAYIKALGQPENAGKKPGDKLTIKYKKDGEWKTFESDDVPMWVSSEAQAFKKTLVKRVYKELPKLPKHKFLDDRISAQQAELQVIMPDPDETHQLTPEEIEAFTIIDDDVVDTNSGEVVGNANNVAEPAAAELTEKERKAAEKKQKAADKKAKENQQPEPPVANPAQEEEFPEDGF